MKDKLFMGLGGVAMGMVLTVSYVFIAPDKDYEALQKKTDQLSITLREKGIALANADRTINRERRKRHELELKVDHLELELGIEQAKNES